MTLPLCVLGAGVVHGLCVAALLPMLVTLPAVETATRAPTAVPVDVVASSPLHSSPAGAQRSTAIALAPGMASVAADVPSETVADASLGDTALTTGSLAAGPAPSRPEGAPDEAIAASARLPEPVGEQVPRPALEETATAEPNAPQPADAAVEPQTFPPVKIEPVSTVSQPQPVIPEEPVSALAATTSDSGPAATQSSSPPLLEDKKVEGTISGNEATPMRASDADVVGTAPPAADATKPEAAETAKAVANADPSEAVPAASSSPAREAETRQAKVKPVTSKRPAAQGGQVKPRAVSPPKAQARSGRPGAATSAKRTATRSRQPTQARTVAAQPARGGMFKLFAGPSANARQSAVRR